MRARSVTIVGDRKETIDSLEVYLTGVGVTAHATRSLKDARKVAASVMAVVLFPDDFDADEVVATLLALRAARPKVLILLVTSAPQHLRAALDPDGLSLPPLVLPRPAFGWTIVDAIRANTQPELAS